MTKGNTWAEVFGSAHRSTEIAGRLRASSFKSRIYGRVTRNHPLPGAQANADRNRSKICARIEHALASQQIPLGGRIVRTSDIERALAKTGL